ncbi:hypothetical protein QFC20_006329 [Naganishia adeliensis]|uniref:Uncharacterized protein n=1 Tax=Naganishia adeliensis TaxID=92952 RepID=A0ACC2VCR8_9TREE|nr:hypothetical protein QFC20_006329 [Naganishia adeliensis]
MDQDPIVQKGKKTIFVTGFDESVKEQELLQAFVTFGDIIEIAIPTDPHNRDKPRGFAFISFSNALDAQDAIDNYDMNELPGHEGKGKYLKVNLARPDTKISGPKGDQAVWATEEWLQEHAKPLDESGGQGVQAALPPGRSEEDVAME